MKRRIWLIAGVVAILGTAWLIKKSRSSLQNQTNIPEGIHNQEAQNSSTTPGNSVASSSLSPGQTPVAAADHAHTIGGSVVGTAETAGDRPKVAIPSQTDAAGNPVVSGDKLEHQTEPQANGYSGAVPGTPKVAQDSQISAPAGSVKASGAAGKPVQQNESGKASTPASASLTQNSGAPTQESKGPPTPTPDVRLKASPAELSCEEQWKQHAAIFKVGSDLAYMTTLAVQRPLAPDIAASHIETVLQSSTATVKREIAFSSDHPTGILVLTSISPAPEVTTTKDGFLSLCHATGGRAVHSVLYKLSRAKVLDIADVSVKVGAGTFPAYQMKIEGALFINGKTVNVIADIWMAKNKPGLTVKEVIKIPAKVFTDHGSITISSQLAGTRKI